MERIGRTPKPAINSMPDKENMTFCQSSVCQELSAKRKRAALPVNYFQDGQCLSCRSADHFQKLFFRYDPDGGYFFGLFQFTARIFANDEII